MTNQRTDQELNAEALGWAAPGPEEQAANARLAAPEGSPAAEADEPTPSPVTPAPDATAPPTGDTPAPGFNLPPPVITDAQKGQIRNQANQAAQGYKEQLKGQGWDDASAHHAATQYARAQYLEGENVFHTQAAEQNAQHQVALHYGKEYGVDPALIAHHSSPAAMEAAAKAEKSRNDRVSALENPTTPKTAPQTFDSQKGAPMTDAARKRAYANNEIDLTTAEYKTLYKR